MSDLTFDMQEKVIERAMAVAFMAQLDEEHAKRMREDRDYELRFMTMLDPSQYDRQKKSLDAYCRKLCSAQGVVWPFEALE